MKEFSTQGKLLTFLFFFLLSAVLWLLNALNQNYKTNLNLAISFINYPKNKILLNDTHKKITLIVEGYGYDLLRYNMKSALSPIHINLNKIKLYPIHNDTNKFYFLTNEILNQIASQLKQKIKILDIKPDTIYLQFASLYTKKIFVRTMVKISFAKQFINKSPIEISPMQVSVLGPSYILDTLNYIQTKTVVLNNVHSDIDTLIELLPPPHTTVYPKRVRLKVQVEQYTEVTITVPIKTINVPPQYNLRIFPDKVTIKYLVGFSYYKKIKPKDFTVVVDYNDLKINPGEKLPVHVLHVPQHIYSYQFNPHIVDYIIENKND